MRIASPLGSANIGLSILAIAPASTAIFREFDSYTGVPGQVYYGLLDLAGERNGARFDDRVHLDDARTSRFVAARDVRLSSPARFLPRTLPARSTTHRGFDCGRFPRRRFRSFIW